jgi:hypothetical protein
MSLRERLNLPVAGDGSLVYGTPYETGDGSTIITVARLGVLRPGPHPLGLFIIHDGRAQWEAVVDADRVAFLGVLTGLLSTVIVTLAMLRRPPWPDLSRRQC